MIIDYAIYHIINNYKVGGCAKYDYIRSELLVNNDSLRKELEKIVDIEISLGKRIIISQEQFDDIWNILRNRTDLIGVCGDDFLNK